MTKILTINGMMCAHCQTRVEKALSSVPGVDKVEVDLAKKQAALTLSSNVEEETLKAAVEDAGYDLVEIK